VNCATGIQNSFSTPVDNIFIDNTRLRSSCMSPVVNGLSDNNAQFLTVNNITTKVIMKPLLNFSIYWKMKCGNLFSEI
jgi:hypothetical protein